LQNRLVRSLTLRFTVDDGGRMRCRITEALCERFWMIPDASELYKTLRAVIGEDAACADSRSDGRTIPEPP
jgi:hypothetical protein